MVAAEVASDSEMAAEMAAEMVVEMVVEGAVKSPQGFRPNPKVAHEMDYQMPLVHFMRCPWGLSEYGQGEHL